MNERKIYGSTFLFILFMIGCIFNYNKSIAQDTTAHTHPAESVTAQASDPSAPIIQFSLTIFYSPDVHNSEGSYNYLQIQPVVPLPKFKHFPVKQILRLLCHFSISVKIIQVLVM